MRQNLFVAAALARHEVGAVEAHAHAVADAAHGEREIVAGLLQREKGARQTERVADLRTAARPVADADAFDEAAVGRHAFAHRGAFGCLQVRAAQLLCRFQKCVLVQRERLLRLRRKHVAVRVDRLQIGKIPAPDDGGAFGFTGRQRVIRGKNRRAAPKQRFVSCRIQRFAQTLHPAFIGVAPGCPALFVVPITLKNGGVV